MQRQQKRKRDKSFYVRQAKQARHSRYCLGPDLRGFLVFCNHREKEALNEAYAILNEYSDLLFGPEQSEESTGPPSEAKEENIIDEEEEDLEKELEREKKELSDVKAKPVEKRRFQSVKTEVQNLLFIRTTLENPAQVVTKILNEVKESGQQKCRFMLRLLPVERTCKATEESLEKVAKDVLPKWFNNANEKKEDISFCINFRSRLNNSFSKEDAIRVLGPVIKNLNEKAKVEYKTPDLVVNVEVMKSNCCLSVLPNYYELKKFNLIELANSDGQKAAKDSSDKTELNRKETDLNVNRTEDPNLAVNRTEDPNLTVNRAEEPNLVGKLKEDEPNLSVNRTEEPNLTVNRTEEPNLTECGSPKSENPARKEENDGEIILQKEETK